MLFGEGDDIAPKRSNNSPAGRKRGVSPATWLTALAILPCGCFLGMRARIPYVQAAKLRSQNDAKEARIADLEFKNQHINNEINALNSHDGIDRSARPLGWVDPDEKRIQPPRN